MNIAALEDALIAAVTALNLFKVVQSAGRDGNFKPLHYPAAAACYYGDKTAASSPRLLVDAEFLVLIADKNLKNQESAAQGVYALIDQVRDAIHGSTLAQDDIEPFYLSGTQMLDYDKGIISYQLTFTCRVTGQIVNA